MCRRSTSAKLKTCSGNEGIRLINRPRIIHAWAIVGIELWFPEGGHLYVPLIATTNISACSALAFTGEYYSGRDVKRIARESLETSRIRLLLVATGCVDDFQLVLLESQKPRAKVR